MNIKHQDLIHFSDEELTQLNQRVPRYSDTLQSKVTRMLRHLSNDDTKEQTKNDLIDSIRRLEFAVSLLPTYREALHKVIMMDMIERA